MTAKLKSPSDSARAWPLPLLSRNVLLIFGLGLVLLSLFPFWGSISVAAVFAYGLYPFVRNLSTRFGRGRPRFVVGLCVIALSLLLLLPVTFFSLRLYSLATSPKDGNVRGAFSTQTLAKMASAKDKVESQIVTYGVKTKIFRTESEARESVQAGSAKLLNGILALIPAMIASLPDIFLTLLVFAIFLYLFLSRGLQIREASVKLGVVPEADVKRISKVMQDSCYNSIVSNLIIGLMQSSLVTIGARIGGYSEVVLIFCVVFFFSFIPFIGTAPVAFLLAGVSLLNHNTSSAIILAVTGIVAGTIDNVVRPYLVANGDNEVHPIISFAVIIGAIAVLGLKGIFLGPVILTATVGLLNLPPKAEEVTVTTISRGKAKNAG